MYLKSEGAVKQNLLQKDEILSGGTTTTAVLENEPEYEINQMSEIDYPTETEP